MLTWLNLIDKIYNDNKYRAQKIIIITFFRSKNKSLSNIQNNLNYVISNWNQIEAIKRLNYPIKYIKIILNLKCNNN